jgi:hypothetical protein
MTSITGTTTGGTNHVSIVFLPAGDKKARLLGRASVLEQ